MLLNLGDRVWVKILGKAFVGVGLVTGRRQAANLFQVDTPQGLKSIFEAAEHGKYLVGAKDDPETCEYFVPMKWLQTVPLSAAVYEIELFGNQNTICQPTAQKWRSQWSILRSSFQNAMTLRSRMEMIHGSNQDHVPGNSADGLRSLTTDNWSGACLVITRKHFEAGQKTAKLDRPGVYILVGPSHVENRHIHPS